MLKTTGSDVVYCAAFRVFDVAKREMPDVLVLCHTLAHEEAEALAQKVHAYCPKTRVLKVSSQTIDDGPHPHGMFDATSRPEPAPLVARTTELLQRLRPNHVTEIAPDSFQHSEA